MGLRMRLTEEAKVALAGPEVAEEAYVAAGSAAEVQEAAEEAARATDACHRWEACHRYGQRPASSCHSPRGCRPPG